MAVANKNLFFIFLVILMTGALSIMATSNKGNSTEKTVLISAASSLTEALEDIVTSFNSLYPEVTVRVSFGGSGYLATQIENGAPVDILISADQKDAARLISKNLAGAGSSIILCRNTLILAGFGSTLQSSAEKSLREILEQGIKVGIGNPDYVAAGFYARNLLIKEGLYNRYSAKFVRGNTVRQVVGWLEAGEVDYAFIYKSDTRLNPAITTFIEFPPSSDPEIIYPSILTLKGEENSQAKLFQSFLTTREVKNILSDYGFIPDRF